MLSRFGLLLAGCVVVALNFAGFCGMASVAAARQGGGPPPNYGIDFVTIGSPGNAPFVPVNPPNPFFDNGTRGSVGYEYRIGRTEITTGQWMNFINTFWTQGNFPGGLFGLPSHWGAARDFSYMGPGRRYVLIDAPDAAMRPVFGIAWRDAARYCNWLHNEQSSDLSALQNGAYDTSTFTNDPDNPSRFNDQRTHNPDARFWIPTWDEWLKATHYDPDRNGPGQEGWWLYPNGSDTQPIPGPPGVGETSAGYRIEPFGHFNIPLGAYPDTLSPWGLLDVTGGAREWTEETLEEVYGERILRVADGNYAGNTIGEVSDTDRIVNLATDDPSNPSTNTLRIASSVPPPPTGLCGVILSVLLLLRRKRP